MKPAIKYKIYKLSDGYWQIKIIYTHRGPSFLVFKSFKDAKAYIWMML